MDNELLEVAQDLYAGFKVVTQADEVMMKRAKSVISACEGGEPLAGSRRQHVIEATISLYGLLNDLEQINASEQQISAFTLRLALGHLNEALGVSMSDTAEAWINHWRYADVQP